VTAIAKIDKLQKSFLQSAVENLSDEDIAMLDGYILHCIEKGTNFSDLAESYKLICKDTLREQIFFQRHGQYRHSKYEDVASDVYHNDDYMAKYMHGLALTAFLWPNHLKMKDFFLQTFPRDKTGRYLEIGPGHGLFFMNAMRHGAFDTFEGVDISRKSIEMTETLLRNEFPGESANYKLVHQDFLKQPSAEKYDAIVMGEVLEHVENPDAFLKKMHDLSNPGAYVFITTCFNCPAIDHIYLFRSHNDLAEIVHSSGFEIKEELQVPYTGLSIEESEKQRLPINVAMVLSRQ